MTDTPARDVSGLIEQLRDGRRRTFPDGITLRRGYAGIPLCVEAADALAASQAREAEFEAAADESTIERAVGQQQLDELANRVAELVEALEPFATCADELDGTEFTPRAPEGEWAKFRLLTDDYRRARAALAKDHP